MFEVTRRKRIEPDYSVDPVPYRFRKLKKRLGIFDSETDPFSPGVVVKPFTCGFFDGDQYWAFWGADCIQQFFNHLATYDEEFLIAVHNGGNFDFYFMLDHMDANSAPFIMNGRLTRIYMQGQEFRDSYTLIPVALSVYQKTEIEYSKFTDFPIWEIHGRNETTCRELYRDEIADYLEDDCRFLYDLVKAAYDEFGDKLTMASVALPMLRSFHGFDQMSSRTDETMRPFYFGGHNEAFEFGVLHPSQGTEWKIYDVNSMYPAAMATFKHPISCTPQFERQITPRTHFAKITATSKGALPVRLKNGGLSFPHCTGEFFACIHEIKAAQELGLLKIHRVHFSIYFRAETDFSEFVNTFYTRRQEAKAAGDKIRIIFWKLVLNSAYGKFAQDPRKYETFLFDPPEAPSPFYCATCDYEEADGVEKPLCEVCLIGTSAPDGWRMRTIRDGKIIYARPQTRAMEHSFFNVATAASITSAARALLLRGIASAERPIYCDTDSIICERFHGDTDDSRLGAWKLEATGSVAYIAGKKLYAIMNGDEEVKKASKGVKLTAAQIARVSQGETIEYKHPVPKFKLDGRAEFITRNISRTGEL